MVWSGWLGTRIESSSLVGLHIFFSNPVSMREMDMNHPVQFYVAGTHQTGCPLVRELTTFILVDVVVEK